jgi:hypothetical protein
VVKIRERLAVNEQGLHKFHMERFNLRKLDKVEGVEVSNRFSALKDLDRDDKLIVVLEKWLEKVSKF